MDGAAASASALAPTIFAVALVVIILARRTYGMLRGAPYSAERLFGFAGFYAALFALLSIPTVLVAAHAWGLVGALLPIPYAAVVAAGTTASAPHVRRVSQFERRDDGRWYYRVPGVIPVVVLALFALRFGIEVGVLGLASGSSAFLLPSPLPPNFLYVLVGVDLLFGGSVGLLLGRAFGVHRAYRERAATSPAGPTSAQPVARPP